MTAAADRDGAGGRVRTLERDHYRSSFQVLERYGVPYDRLESWRERAEPRFPPAVEVVGENDCFFHLLHLVQWEMSFTVRRGRQPALGGAR
jgi:hypothetical protein